MVHADLCPSATTAGSKQGGTVANAVGGAFEGAISMGVCSLSHRRNASELLFPQFGRRKPVGERQAAVDDERGTGDVG
jgi:hypothetical protein